MDSLPTWAMWGVVVPCVVLSPAIALLLAIAIEILIGCLMDAGAPALLALIIVGAGGLFLFRKLHPQVGTSAEGPQPAGAERSPVPPAHPTYARRTLACASTRGEVRKK
jgi:hypothetical protein